MVTHAYPSFDMTATKAIIRELLFSFFADSAKMSRRLGRTELKAMDEGGPQKIISIRTLNHFAV